MRNFNYTWLEEECFDHRLINLICEIHEHKGRLDSLLIQKPAELARLTKIAKEQSTLSSNQIEGLSISKTRLKNLITEKVSAQNLEEEEIAGYYTLLDLIDESDQFMPIKPEILLQLHQKIKKNSGGRFKGVNNYINEIRSDGTAVTRFVPLSAVETPQAMEQLCKAYLKVINREKVDPLLLIPIFILDFLCIHPFEDGNGRLSRILTLLLLYQNGFLAPKFISLEQKIELTQSEYYQILQECNTGWHEGKNDPWPFVRYMLGLLLSCYIDLEEKLGINNDFDKKSAYQIVRDYIIQKPGKITSFRLQRDCPGIGRSSIVNSLSRLVEEGLLIRFGKGKNTFYVLKDNLPGNPA